MEAEKSTRNAAVSEAVEFPPKPQPAMIVNPAAASQLYFCSFMNHIDLDLDICRQPDNTTCGPTCLQAVYAYYNDPISLQQVIAETSSLTEGGTLAVYLACHALRRGYKTTIIPYDLQFFDPTWSTLSNGEIKDRLRRQLIHKKSIAGFQVVTEAYLEYLELGGRLRFKVLTPSLIRRYLKKSIPILTGLSATYLYNSAREYGAGEDYGYDDIRGESTGHFVVLTGYKRENRQVLIADPLKTNPIANDQHYAVDIYRLVCAIMLGILSYDGNLLMIQKKAKLPSLLKTA